MKIGNSIENLEYWIQKAVPNTFDDSLSLYELVSKTVKYLNEVITQSNELTSTLETTLATQNTDISTLRDEFEAVKTWVEGEALTENTTQVLNEWYDNGKLATIINQDVMNMKAEKTELQDLENRVEPMGSSTYTYDVNGILTAAENQFYSYSYTYDAEGTLTQILATNKSDLTKVRTTLSYDSEGTFIGELREVVI